MRIPAFKSHFRIHRLPPDLIFFLGEGGSKVLQGPLLFHLVPAIDGRRTVAEITRALRDRLPALDVECGLLMLESEGLLFDAERAEAGGLELLRDSWNV